MFIADVASQHCEDRGWSSDHPAPLFSPYVANLAQFDPEHTAAADVHATVFASASSCVRRPTIPVQCSHSQPELGRIAARLQGIAAVQLSQCDTADLDEVACLLLKELAELPDFRREGCDHTAMNPQSPWCSVALRGCELSI
jgi:hypothetical protein